MKGYQVTCKGYEGLTEGASCRHQTAVSGLCKLFTPVDYCERTVGRHSKVLAGQSHKHSIAEAWVNVVVGFSVNYIANLLIFPLFGFSISLLANFWMGVIYTGISLVRSYFIRRYFNSVMVKLHLRKGNE